VTTLTHAIEVVRFGGTIYYFGVPDDPVYPIPMNTFLRKNLTLMSGFTIDRRRVLQRADDYLRRFRHLADDYITDVYPADEAEAAFAAAGSPGPARLKVVLDMTTP
jgi:threonine dehydrogenase-like Zn-dependent dehydrogenase